jgi:hypothetical protein
MRADPPAALKYSGRLARKGVLLEETYRIFTLWDVRCSLRENIAGIRANNPIGAANQAWLREVTATISNRFSTGDSLVPLVTLAKAGLPIDTWKHCLLWHFGSCDGLYSDFSHEFLFPHIQSGVAVFTTDDVIPFVRDLVARGVFGESLSDYGVRRLARDLLRASADFGFLKGSARREVIHTVIPEDALLYALYSLSERGTGVDRILESSRWKLFLMRPDQVERELLNLHQFRRLHYDCAGSIRSLSLPHPSLMAFAQSLIA